MRGPFHPASGVLGNHGIGVRRGDEQVRPIAAGLKLGPDHIDKIDQSHERCVALGVSRIERPDHNPLGRSDLAVVRDRNLRLHDHAAPVMEMLYEQIVNTESMVVLCDATGTIRPEKLTAGMIDRIAVAKTAETCVRVKLEISWPKPVVAET